MTGKMAGIDDLPEWLPGQQETQSPQTSRTLLKGQALYSTDLNGHFDVVSPDISTGTRHEVEVKLDQDGLVRMDIYNPRTLVNSIPLRSGVMPFGALESFQVIPSNRRENVLCVIHQTSGGPKYEYLIFRQREEMNQWLDKLHTVVFANPTRRPTDPTHNRSPSNTKRNKKTASALDPECFRDLEHRSHNKSPVEVDWQFRDDDVDDGDHTLAGEDARGGPPSFAELGLDSGVVVPQFEVLSASASDGVGHLPVPSAYVGTRSPSISTISNAGETSQRARRRHDNTKSIGEIFSQLRQETCSNELTVNISVKDACLLKMFDFRGHTWVRDRCGSTGLYGGDLINTINGEKVTSTQMFRDRIEAMTADNQVVLLTVGRLPQASLLMMRTLPSGEHSFTTEGTKVKSVDIESDDGLFRIVKAGNAYITNINGRFVPYGSTTAEVTAHLQTAGDEFVLVLHPKEFADKLQ